MVDMQKSSVGSFIRFSVEVLFPKTFLSCRPTSSKSPAFHASPSLHNLNLETRHLYTVSTRVPALWQAPNLPKKPTEIRLCDQNDKYPLLQPIFRQLQAWQLVCQIDRFLRDGFRIISGTKNEVKSQTIAAIRWSLDQNHPKPLRSED